MLIVLIENIFFQHTIFANTSIIVQSMVKPYSNRYKRWSAEDKELLIMLYERYGTHYKLYQPHYKGRTYN